MAERPFIVTKEEDTFLLGHFDGEQLSGAYLSPEYIVRLRQIRDAVGVRLGALGGTDIPDALKNLLGVIDRLTKAHAEQARTEKAPPNPADLEEIAQVEKELTDLARQLEGFTKGPDGPRKK